jgi:hypothetical protein
MPRVNGKEYPYTKSGMAAAEKAKKKAKGQGKPAEKLKPQAPKRGLLPIGPESRRRNIPLDGPAKAAPKMTPVSKTRISGATTSRAGSIIGGIAPMPKPMPNGMKRRVGRGKPLFPKKPGR